MKNNSIIGIDLGSEKIVAAYYDNTCPEPIILASIDGYGVFSEDSIEKVLLELKEKIGNKQAIAAISGDMGFKQLKTVKNIADKIGIEIRRFLPRSSAAALSFEFQKDVKQRKDDETIIVCVLDNNNIEIALAELGEGLTEIFAIDWDNNFDINYYSEHFIKLIKRVINERERKLIECASEEGKPTDNIKFNIDNIDDIILTGDNQFISNVKPMILDIFHKEAIITDNATSIGASINGAILSGELKDKLLLDVITMSYGIETSSGKIINIIKRNTTIPTRASRLFPFSLKSSLTFDININIFEGNSDNVQENKLVANIPIKEIISESSSEIEIAIDIDSNKNIHAFVKELNNGKEVKYRLK